MSYLPKIAIYGSDDGTIDAFARIRMSEPYTIFDSKQIIDSGSLFWDVSGSSGALAQYSQSRASTTLYVSNSVSSLIKQTKIRFNYQPGKSQLILTTFGGDTTPDGIVKQVGYFDDRDGIFFQISGSHNYVGIRSSVTGTPVDTLISQSNWSLDKLDGTGPSRYTLDLTKSQIFFTDFEWLGVGRVRFGFFIDGGAVYVHENLNANVSASVYMSSPNLPIRYAIHNITGTNNGSFEQICSSVISEGGFNPLGVLRSVDIGGFTDDVSATGRTLAANKYESLLAIRLKTGSLDVPLPASVVPVSLTVVGSTTANGKWSLLLNPLVGGTSYNWQPLEGSSIEYSIVDAQTILSESIKIDSGYFASNVSTAAQQLQSVFSLGANIDGERDILVLGVWNISGNETFWGSLTFRELI